MGNDLFELLTGYPFSVTMVCEGENQVNLIKAGFNKKQKRALKYDLIEQDAFDFRTDNTIITTDLKLLLTSNLVIEAITEDILQKRTLFKQIKEFISSSCIVITNSSSIPPDQLFSEILNEGRCLGLHFFYPVALKDIVEVNLGEKTSDETTSIVKKFLQKLNKFHIILTKNDHFIINRIFLKMQARCCQILEEGTLDYKEIDALVKAHLFPIGIFEFFDHVGNDVMLHSVRNYLKYETNKGFYKPLINVLEHLVNQGKLGVKTNSGFYNYPIIESNRREEISNADNRIEKITYWYLDGVFDAMEKIGLSKVELEHIVKEYMMVEESPFELAKEIGYTPK